MDCYLARRRPYTFVVLAVFILISGVLSIVSTPKDIFPSINIPVISVIWSYTGWHSRIWPTISLRHTNGICLQLSTTSIISSAESLYGIAVVKIFLQPHASVPQAIAQVTSISQFVLKQLPTGITPALVLDQNRPVGLRL